MRRLSELEGGRDRGPRAHHQPEERERVCILGGCPRLISGISCFNSRIRHSMQERWSLSLGNRVSSSPDLVQVPLLRGCHFSGALSVDRAGKRML